MVVLLDTGFILAIRNSDDVNHNKATELMRECLSEKYGRIIVSNFVFDETVTLTLVRTRNKSLVRDIGDFIFDSPRITLLHLSETEFLVTWEFFLKYFEKGLSFTDCSLLVMAKLFESNVYIATFDRHFKGLLPVLG
ncbi:MAG: type II toxin-antitoxin system VapC family toxin [Candidatus Thorarchaeota archaeon]